MPTFIGGVPAEAMNEAASREIVLKLGSREISFDGKAYLLGFALPNFFFHVTTAYDILRHNGLDIGKRDYLGSPGFSPGHIRLYYIDSTIKFLTGRPIL